MCILCTGDLLLDLLLRSLDPSLDFLLIGERLRFLLGERDLDELTELDLEREELDEL